MFVIFCATSYITTDLKGRKADERRIKLREGCEGQDEVKGKILGGKPVKGIYTLPLSLLKDSQGGRLTSTQPIYQGREIKPGG